MKGIKQTKRLKEYKKTLIKEAKKFRLTPEDLSNLYDSFYMLDDSVYETFKLNKMEEWFHQFHQRIEKVVVPELYERKIEK